MKSRKKTGWVIVDLFDKMIRNSKNGRRLQPNGSRISNGTIQNYCFTQKLVKEFQISRNVILKVKLAPSVRELKVEKSYWKRVYKDFTDFLYHNKGHYDNYVGQTIKNIRVLFNFIESELSLSTGNVQKCLYVRKEEPPIFPLLPEELRFLIKDRVFDEKLSPRLRQVKDFFVFGCTVALRVTDLLKLRVSNLRKVENGLYLQVRTSKTGVDTMIKLPVYATEIIKRSAKYGRLLPHFNKSNLNKYIKQLLAEAGFTSAVQKIRTIRGKPVLAGHKDGIRFCDLASTHTMRRTAITTMLSLGVPETIVRKISGHSPGSKEFYRYVRWAQLYQDKETQRMFDMLVDS